MVFSFGNPLRSDREASIAPWWDSTRLNGHELAALCAFSQALKEEPKEKLDVNPLLPCMQLWMSGTLKPIDSLHITLPPSDIFKVHKTKDRMVLTYTLELQGGGCQVDGLAASRAAYPWIFTYWRVAWLTTTLCASVGAFFVILASNATPSLATALALSYAGPLSNDYSWDDAGCPPSWNGRIRVRWGEGFACGVFSGPYKGRPGRTGTSVTRCSTVWIVSWVTWARREQLKDLLDFRDDQAISTWVKWVAVFVLGLFNVIAYVHAYGLWTYGQAHLGLFLALYAGGFGLIAFSFAWRIVHNQETWWLAFIYSELGFCVFGSIFPAIVMVGINPRNGALGLWSKYAWIYIVLVSCLNG
jgi:hypothetical protein